MSTTATQQEGFIPFRGMQTWYRIIGDGEEPGKQPLLCLHGGPGAPHGYISAIGALAETGRRVIFYDQIGCGKSDRLPEKSLCSVDLFIDELREVRAALGLDDVHILGQSWGGMLAMEYALTRPAGLTSLILSNTAASIPYWMREAHRLRSELPKEVQQTLRHHEESGTTDDPAYEEATMAFYQRHVCRADTWPEEVLDAFANMNHDVYGTMWGPNEFTANGLLRNWDITDRLGEIDVPALVICGQYDEATPALAEELQRGLPNSELVVLEDASHLSFVEQPDQYMQAVERFLSRVEAAWSATDSRFSQVEIQG